MRSFCSPRGVDKADGWLGKSERKVGALVVNARGVVSKGMSLLNLFADQVL